MTDIYRDLYCPYCRGGIILDTDTLGTPYVYCWDWQCGAEWDCDGHLIKDPIKTKEETNG